MDNKKRIKQHKHGGKVARSKADNGDAEVFVLPPDILQKLGIHLGGIDSVGDCDISSDAQRGTKFDENDQIANAKNMELRKGDETILETASLMKKSVFLSPTFISTISSIPGEVEISGIIGVSQQSNDFNESENCDVNMVVIPEKLQINSETSIKENVGTTDTPFMNLNNTESNNINQDHNETSASISYAPNLVEANELNEDTASILENLNKFSDNSDTKCQELNGEPSQLKDHNADNKSVYLENMNELVSVDDHLDEAYSSDCSNSNLGSVDNTDVVSYIPHELSCNSQVQQPFNKINIISEEIIDSSRLRELKILHSPNKTALTSVTVESIIAKRKTYDSSCMDAVNNADNFQKNNIVDDNTDKIPDRSSDTDVSNLYQTNTICAIENRRFYENSSNVLSPPQVDLVTNKIQNFTESPGVFNASKDSCDLTENSTKNVLVMKQNPDHEAAELTCQSQNILNSHNEDNVQSCGIRGICNDISVDSQYTNDLEMVKETISEEKQNVKNEILFPENISNHVKIEKSITSSKTCNNKSEMENISDKLDNTTERNCNADIEKSNCIDLLVNVNKPSKQGDEVDQEHRDLVISTTDNINNESSQYHNIVDASNKSINSLNDTKTPIDKINEIASYISTFVKSSKNKKSMKKEIAGNRKLPVKSNASILKSKICIQGVEKPGGKQENKQHKAEPEVVRTYQNCNRQKQHCIEKDVIFKSNHEILCKTSEVVEEELNIITLSDSCKTQQYCICGDFGRLDYYDCDSLYEHIHFWKQDVTDCSSELIFSIYSDNNNFCYEDSESTDVIEHIDDTNTEITDCNQICWNYSKCKNSEAMRNVDLISQDLNMAQGYDASVSDINKPAEIENTNDLLNDIKKNECQEHDDTIDELSILMSVESENQSSETVASEISKLKPEILVSTRPSHNTNESMEQASKRKYSDQTIIIETFHNKQELIPNKTERNNSKSSFKPMKQALNSSSNEPPPKKSIKCGVCNQILSELEWEDHISKEHCYIAWKSGHVVELENADLLQKLEQRLKDIGVLKCTFCDSHMKRIKSFIPHIKNCIKTSTNSDSASTSSVRDNSMISNSSVVCDNENAGIVSTSGATEETAISSSSCNKIQFDSTSSQIQNVNPELVSRSTRKMKQKKVGLSLSPITKNDNVVIGSPLASTSTPTVQSKNTELDPILMPKESKSTPTDQKKKHDLRTRLSRKSQNTDVDKSKNDKDVSKSKTSVQNKITDVELTATAEHKNLQYVSKLIPGYKNKNITNTSIATAENVTKGTGIDATLAPKDKNKNKKSSDPALSEKNKSSQVTSNSTLKKKNKQIDFDPTSTSKEEKQKAEVVSKLESRVDKVLDSTLEFENGSKNEEVASKSRVKSKNTNVDPMSKPKGKNKSDEVASEFLMDNINKKRDINSTLTPTEKNKNVEMASKPISRKTYKNTNLSSVATPRKESYNVEEVFKSTAIGKHNHFGSMIMTKDKNEKAQEAFKSRARDTNADTDTKSTPETLRDRSKNVERDFKSTPKGRNKSSELASETFSRIRNVNTDVGPMATPEDNIKNTDMDSSSVTILKNGNSDIVFTPTATKRSKSDISASKTKKKNKNRDTDSASTSEQKGNVTNTDKSIKCGVCKEILSGASWIGHIAKEHNYLAWEDGTPPIEMNEDEVKQHLNKISKENGGLICSKCGFVRKYVKSYLDHLKTCENVMPLNDSVNDSVNGSINETNTNLCSRKLKFEPDVTVKCGVCHKEVDGVDWISHIQKKHNYIAWIEGETPLDMNDEEDVQQHLWSICRKNGGLVCGKCGLVRKYVKVYLQHLKTCEGSDDEDAETESGSQSNNIKEVQCAVCLETMNKGKWKSHAMNEHYNVAWVVGKTPIDLRSAYSVEKHLKEYKELHGQMICKVCKISRVSYSGFYAHILACGKTEEETERFKDTCDICNSKYLCIYKSPHMAMHREQEYAKERKLKKAEDRDKAEQMCNSDVTTSGRRKAAEKAKTVIEKYKSIVTHYNHTCSKCGFGTDHEEELTRHECVETGTGYTSDSDVSVKLEQCSDDDSPDSEVDSDVSEQELADTRRKLNRESRSASSKVTRIPFKIRNASSYLQESYNDFCAMHFTNETLFPQWRHTEYEVVPDEEVAKYLPPLKESCKVKLNNDSWIENNRFEAKEITGCHVMFAGASVQCVSWAPAHVDDKGDNCGFYLAVASHSSIDQPRFGWEEAPSHSGLLQIWDIGDFSTTLPKLVLGIAHDYGTVWEIDWCPSGARDLFFANQENVEASVENRLGLLAAACSNGVVYIFSVPDKLFYKLKPKVELRLSSHADREKSQATSVCWSSQKGHATVIVGYSNGTSAFYDLNCESPMLKTVENDVTILFPFHDERSQNSSVTGVSMYPAGESAWCCGAWCSASVSGARLSSGASACAAARGAAVHSYAAAAGVGFAPLWPSAVLAGEDCVVGQAPNELEWFGGGRRLGAVRRWCASARRGRLLAATPPLLRVMRAHPVRKEIHKQVVGIIQMSPIAEKRKRGQSNDELAMKLEPLEYHDAVKKYGIELTLVAPKDNVAQSKALSLLTAHFPERYPLADISSLAFCPSDTYNKKAALATHSGIIFLIDAAHKSRKFGKITKSDDSKIYFLACVEPTRTML